MKRYFSKSEQQKKSEEKLRRSSVQVRM